MANPTTQSERVYGALRADILAGRVQPGHRLPFVDLCARYGASMGVLREGLSRLSEQGLVVLEPHQGYRVKPLSLDDLDDLTAARVQIESWALREAVRHGDLVWESQLIAAHHTLAHTPYTGTDERDRLSEAWTVAHANFHSAILAGCPNRRLRAIAEGLRDSAELYRQWSVSAPRGRTRDVAAEHQALLDALLDRNADIAAAVLTTHIGYTRSLLLERSTPDRDDSKATA